METVIPFGPVPFFTFEESLEWIITKIRTATRKPYIVSLHGYPNAGKSTFGWHCRDRLFKEHHLSGPTIMRGDTNHELIYRYALDFLFLEDQPGILSAQRYTQELFNRPPDQYFLLAHSLQHHELPIELSGFYHRIIVNPAATIKR
ncbi:hypothetical protein HYT55_04655 [Candidatus Woesearchaeota archaeon]|nr:hypothetical protein [Candidatus Woesearchaeota archaeon]